MDIQEKQFRCLDTLSWHTLDDAAEYGWDDPEVGRKILDALEVGDISTMDDDEDEWERVA